MADRETRNRRPSGRKSGSHTSKTGGTKRPSGSVRSKSSDAIKKSALDRTDERVRKSKKAKKPSNPVTTLLEKNGLSINLVLMALLALIVVVALIAGVVKHVRGGSSMTSYSMDDEGNMIQAAAESIALNDAEVKTEVIALVRNYRAALASADVETLKRIFNTHDLKNENTYLAMSMIITSYQNTECYIRKGLDDASRVVFIYDDLTLAGFDTLIPNVTVVYVRAAADGSFFIDRGIYNEETMSFQYDRRVTDLIDNLKNDGEISELIRSTNQRFSEACATNPELKNYIDMLNASVAAAMAETTAPAPVETEALEVEPYESTEGIDIDFGESSDESVDESADPFGDDDFDDEYSDDESETTGAVDEDD